MDQSSPNDADFERMVRDRLAILERELPEAMKLLDAQQRVVVALEAKPRKPGKGYEAQHEKETARQTAIAALITRIRAIRGGLTAVADILEMQRLNAAQIAAEQADLSSTFTNKRLPKPVQKSSKSKSKGKRR